MRKKTAASARVTHTEARPKVAFRKQAFTQPIAHCIKCHKQITQRQLNSHLAKLWNTGRAIHAQCLIKNPSLYPTSGMTNAIPEHPQYAILFMDIDNARWKPLKHRLQVLQHQYHLGDIYILKTRKNSYHIICLDLLLKEVILDILYEFTYYYPELRKYLCAYVIRGKNVLRTEKKHTTPAPKYYATMKSPYTFTHDKSKAHAKYLHLKYKLLLPPLLSDNTILETEKYKTLKP